VKHCNNDNVVLLDCELDRIRKALEESSPNSRLQVLIAKWAVRDTVIRGIEFIEVLESKSRPLAFVPVER
jgi:hypothetical protein